ncbi:MAG: hypothetical protein IT233_05270 [Bacteroidia bacterium]|nr:hypothetical protein [Bacteroidia bacterium]
MKTAWIAMVLLAVTATMSAQQKEQPLKKIIYGGKSEVKITMKKEPLPLSLQDVLKSLASEEQVFRITANRDTVLKGKKGTLIYYYGNSLVDENGNAVSGKVWMKLKESTEYSEMMGDGLSTVTDSGLLETRGMFRLGATDGKQELQLKPGASMTLMVPNTLGNGNMQVWDGVNGSTPGITSWRSNPNPVSRFQPSGSFYCGWEIPTRLVKKCNFWCKFRKFLGFRKNVKTYRRSSTLNTRYWSPLGCAGIDSLISRYNIRNYDQLLRYVYLPLMKQYRVHSLPQLFLKMQKEYMAGLENTIATGNAGFRDLNYYVFSTQKLNWKNLDEFYHMSDAMVVEQKINQPVEEEMSVSLIFKHRRMMVAAYIDEDNNYHYPRVPRNETGTVVAIRMQNGKPMLATHTIRFEGENLDLQFREVSMEELKEEIRKAGL